MTFRRLELIVQLKSLDGEIEAVRKLARVLGRDKKNVSEDVQALRRPGLIRVPPQGHGRAHEIRLAGHRIDLHLLDASDERPAH